MATAAAGRAQTVTRARPYVGPGARVRTARRGGDGTRGGASPCPAELIAGRRRLACQL
jgi:hypothetical protein